MVKRYYIEMDGFETGAREVEDPTGAYIQYDDYAELESEVERLNQAIHRIAEDVLPHPVRYDDITPEMVRDAFIQYHAVRRDAEIERMKAELSKYHQAFGLLTTLSPQMEIDVERPMEMAQKIIVDVTADIAALVTALDEATTHTGYTRWLTPHETEFIPDPKSTKKYRCFDDLTPESRAVAERWLAKKENK